MNIAEHLLQRRLESLNFDVIKIRETDDKTADFYIKDDNNYLIEYKIREDNSDLNKDLDENGYFLNITITAKTNTVYQILKDAKNQLIASGKSFKTDYNIIWFHLKTSDNDHSLKQIMYTVYGAQDLLLKNEGTNSRAFCYYFNESFFFKYKEIVAIIVEFDNGIYTCLLNDYSPKSTEFKLSRLGLYLKDAITTPEDKINGLYILIADCNINRKNKMELIEYLNGKYSINISCPIDFNHFHGRIG